MKQVNIHYAKTHLSAILTKVLQGEDVFIAKAGKPIVRITRIEQGKRRLGFDKGKVKISPDFDDPMAEIDNMFMD